MNDPPCDRCVRLKHPCEKRGEEIVGCRKCTASKVGCGLVARKKPRVGKVKEAKEVKGTRSGGGGRTSMVAEVQGLREDMGELSRTIGELGEKLGEAIGEVALVMRSWWARECGRERDAAEVVVMADMGGQAVVGEGSGESSAEGSGFASAVPPADVAVPMDL